MATNYEKAPSKSTDSFDLRFDQASLDESTPFNSDDFSFSTTTADDDIQPPTSYRLDPRIISDAILGLSDGMTVPFALTAGLSELGDTRVVVLAGLAELVAGAISMGLGGYLGAKSEKEIYNISLHKTHRETLSSPPTHLTHRIKSTFTPFHLPPPLLQTLSSHLSTSPHLPKFLLHFDLGISEPPDSRAIVCAITIATGYFLGGLVPLMPYLLVGRGEVGVAMWVSVLTMVVVLFVLGAGKAWVVGVVGEGRGEDEVVMGRRGWGWGRVVACLRGGLGMVLVGGVSAGSAVACVKGFNSLL